MGLGKLGNTIEILSSIFSDGGSSKRKIIIESDNETLVIPVYPNKYNVGSGQKNKVVDITQIGEALVFGMPKARTLSFSGFFPALIHEYPFVVGDKKSPTECVELLTKWKEQRKPVRVIITDSPVNMMMGITDFPYNEQDGSRDIYYTLSFTEYKDLNTPAANNDKQVDKDTGLKSRPVDAAAKVKEEEQKINKKKDFFKKGADIMDTAKKAYGNYNHWRRIVKSNDLKNLALNNAKNIRKWIIK